MDDNFPRNCWYAAATSDEIRSGLLARQLLGQYVTLYRTSSGEVVALEDRCAHRGLPLSAGTVVDDLVVCRYHGFSYDHTGACVRVPSQPHVPYGARVRRYPVLERPPFVWVWLGAERRAEGSPPPRLPWLTDERWTTFGGALEVAANYMLLHDNALDRTHFPFVHAERIHSGYVDPPPLQIQVSETTVAYTRTFPPAALTEWQQAATGLPADRSYVHRESGIFVSPALHIDHMDVLAAAPADGSPAGEPTAYESVFVRAFTPIDVGRTYVFWRVARNYALDDVAVTEGLRQVHEGTMVEDQPLLELIQSRTQGVPRYTVSAAADAASIKAYQIVDTLLDEERSRLGRVAPTAGPAAGHRPAVTRQR